MESQLTISVYGASDIGKSRSRNEDRFCVEPGFDFAAGPKVVLFPAGKGSLMAVADGMGGANAGDIAAGIAIETVRESGARMDFGAMSSKGIRQALEGIIGEAHRRIKDAADEKTVGMGTTLTLAYLQGSQLHTAWSGDSRIYLYSPSPLPLESKFDLPHLKILTRDHSIVWELVEKGALDPNAAREHEMSNVITQSLGDTSHSPRPESATYSFDAGDKILLCTDGLNGMLPDEFIQEILAHEEPVDQIVQSLILAANEAGGTDNISVVLISILEAPNTDGSGKKVKPVRPEAITAKSSGPGTQLNTSEAGGQNVMMERVMVAIILLALASLLLFWISRKDQPVPVLPDSMPMDSTGPTGPAMMNEDTFRPFQDSISIQPEEQD